MAETLTCFTLPIKPYIKHNSIQTTKAEITSFSKSIEGENSQRASRVRVNALPDWPLMAVLVEHMEGQRDLITHKSIWHLSDQAMKNDPYYDSEAYRKDGGDGTGHWVYEKQEDIEETARGELWREELIEEIEQKVGSLRELEEAGKKEELVK
ncbi:hypothetical protein DH2020_013065 [Rehmannia glutinosa]|uniref:Uncharacterized protein n=1 Tax=Rehmannia glutinosa TaxID=99300 RepID=A0ABR0X1F2_REHGL